MDNSEEKVYQIPIEDIIPNRFQPRLNFVDEGLNELSESIKQHGIIQPLVLRRLGKKFEIIAGERRYKAATMAGLKKVPAIIKDLTDNESAEVAVVENIQRRNLTPIEEAKSYKSLLDRGYLTQEQLAQRMGVSQSSIANKLRLLNLAPEVQDALLQEKISERHARSLLSLSKEDQVKWLNEIINRRLTVRQLDLELKKLNGEEKENFNEPKFFQEDNNLVKGEEKNEEETPVLKEPEEKGKFFSFLEDEASEINTRPKEETGKVELNNIENIELDELPMEEEKDEPKFLNDSNAPENNKIIDVSIPGKEELMNPMDMASALAPDLEEVREEDEKLNLTNTIDTVRTLIDYLNNHGMNVNTEELDLSDKYQIIININKD